MIKLYLSLPNKINCKIITKEDIIFDDRAKTLARAYLPGVKFLVNKPKRIDFSLEYIKSVKKKLIVKEKSIKIYENWSEQLPLDFFHILYSKTRLMFIKKHNYPVHSACVGNKDYSLIVGHTRSGKTSVLIELLKKNMKVFSGNKTLVSLDSGINAVAGTSTITLDAKIFKKNKSNVKESINYSNRKAFALNPDNYSRESLVRINKIFLIKINGGVREFRRLDRLEALYSLYPFFLDVVNADTIMFQGGDVFLGNISKVDSTWLAKKLLLALKGVNVYYLAGSKQFISERILK